MAWLSPLATVGERLSERVRDGFDAVTNWAGSLEAIDLLLVVVIVWAGYWIVSTLRGMTRLGPVEVGILEHDEPEDSAPPIHALTALLRERLAKSGLMPPPEVPAGSPQTNLIAAVETSGHPQAAWAAALLKLLPHPPRPPQYTLSGTLFSVQTPPAATPERLRYWLKPKNEGRAQVATVEGDTAETAVRNAAAEIVLAIAKDAVHVFPAWSRWEKREALLTYMDAIDEQIADKDDAAFRCFREASKLEPRNLLPRLQLANLLEKHAGKPGSGVRVEPAAASPELTATETPESDMTPAARKARDRARALRMYLDIGVECPSLVAARYRAGVVAGVLADACTGLDEAERSVVRQELRLSPEPENLHTALIDIADDESKAALSLLRRVHVLIDKHRLRHRYEPTGRERRELLQTVAISRHVRRIRQFGSDRSPLGIAWRKAAVRFFHLGILRPSAGWNAHYNAGCFYALLLDRALTKAAASQIDAESNDASASATETLLDQREIRKLLRRAYEELNLAVDVARTQLPRDWLADADPDLEILRRLEDSRWNLLLRRHTGLTSPADPQLPEPAWGDPNHRRNEWLSYAVVCGMVAAVSGIVFDSRMLVFGFGAIGLFALYATAQVRREAHEANNRLRVAHAERIRPAATAPGEQGGEPDAQARRRLGG